MKFYRENKKDAVGVEVSKEEVAERYIVSECANQQRLLGGNFERYFRVWLSSEFGGWDGDEATMNEFYELLGFVWEEFKKTPATLTITVPGRAWIVCCDPQGSGVPNEEGWPTPERKPVGKGEQYIYRDVSPKMADKILTHLQDYADSFLSGGVDEFARVDGRACRDAAQSIRRQIKLQKGEIK